jgi:hypothetical protein
MSNTVTRRRVELSDGQIVIRRTIVETGDNQPVRDTMTSPQAVMADQPERRQASERPRRGVTGWWRKRR